MNKKIFRKILEQGGITSLIIKRLLKFLIKNKICNFKISTLIEFNLTERPHYLYCLYHSAILARRLGLKKISIIEFGVAGGNGIIFLETFVKNIFVETGVEVEIYGFDLGDGLCEPTDHRDLPYWFKKDLYKMDHSSLSAKIKHTKLIIGDVKDTIKDFFKKYNPAPIGAILNDLDYYSSTINSFQIFNTTEDKFYLPRIFCYFDDIIGTEYEMYGVNNGQLLAIDEFNKNNIHLKINLNQNLLVKNVPYKFQIYYFHKHNHRDYNKYLFGEEQNIMSKNLKIRK